MVDDGFLVGIVRKQRLVVMSPDAEVREVMETPAFVEATDAIDELTQVIGFYEGSPIPLVDRSGSSSGSSIPQRSGLIDDDQSHDAGQR